MRSSINYFFVALAVGTVSISSNPLETGRRFEMEHCEEIIPSFIDHISEHGDKEGECREVGQFPKPGDCTVFFKCVRGRGRILPILEYCAIGYNFDGRSCVKSHDLTDCPQFNCKMVNNGTEINGVKMVNKTSRQVTNTVSMSSPQKALQIKNWKNKAQQLHVKISPTIVLFLYLIVYNFY